MASNEGGMDGLEVVLTGRVCLEPVSEEVSKEMEWAVQEEL